MSPLGKYASVVAAMVAVAIIGSYLAALLFGESIGVTADSLTALDKLAFLAAGAVFGASAAVVAAVGPTTALHKRLDEIEAARLEGHAAGVKNGIAAERESLPGIDGRPGARP